MSYPTVTIEGTITPAAGVLARGERKTVAFTERIQGLVQRGFVKVIERHDDELEVVEEVSEVADESSDREYDEPPARNASREDWAEFLALHPAGFVTEGKDRGTLIGEWDTYLAQDDATE